MTGKKPPRKKGKVRRGKMVDGYWFDHEAANRACRFFEQVLVHIEGPLAGEPFYLADWQAHNIIEPAFGWKRPDGTRRYRIVFVAVPRKNGKSTLGAGVGLFLLCGDREIRAQVYSCAADRPQARIVFDTAVEMVEKSEELQERLEIVPSRARMVHPASSSFYQALSADAFTKHGFNSHGYIFDEVHAQKKEDLWNVMRTSTGARANPMGFAITTAGFNTKTICGQLWHHAERVASGEVQDDEFLPVLYAARPMRPDPPNKKPRRKTDPDHPLFWTTEKAWKLANPNLGVSVRFDAIESEVNRAINNPEMEDAVKQLHLNIWTQSSSRWLSSAHWQQLEDSKPPKIKPDRPGYFGLDLARTTDLSSLVGVFPPYEKDKFWRILGWHFCPADTLKERSDRDRVPYRVWRDEGWLTATEGDVTDYDYIENTILECVDRYNLQQLAYDRTFAGELITRLTREEVPVVPFAQGFLSMNPACTEFARKVRKGSLRHIGDPVMSWALGNVTVARDAAGNIKIDKAKSVERVDPIVAAVMAMGRATVTLNKENKYDRGEEILVLG